MADDCLLRLMDPEVQKKLFGERQIPKALISSLLQDIEAIKVAADKDPSLGTYQSRVDKYMKKVEAQSEIERAALLADAKKREIRWKQYTQEGIKDDPIEAILSKLGKGVGKLGEGLKDNAATRGYNISQKHLNYLTGSLMKEKVFEIFMSGKNDLEIRAGVDALAHNREALNISPESKKIAQVVYDHNRRMLQEAHNSDVPTRDLLGFTVSQTHDITAVRAAGFDAWRANVESYGINKELTFGVHAGNVESETKILENIYKGVILGKVGVNSAVEQADIDRIGSSYTNKLTESRELRFNDFNGEHNYNQEYGRSGLAESMYYDVTKKARMLGLVQIFGSNPEKAVLRDLEKLESTARSNQDYEKATHIKANANRVMDMFNEVNGQNTIPGRNTLAQIGSWTRWVQNISKLGFTGLKSGANLATTAVKLKSVTGENLLQTTLGSIHEFVKTLPAGAKDKMMEDAGFFMRDYAEQLTAHDTPMYGAQAKSLKFMFKYTGTDMISNGAKVASVRYMMGAYGRNMHLPWNGLDPRLQAEFMGIGLHEPDFNIMKTAVQTMPDGRKMLTPEGIEKLDLNDPALKARAAELKMSASKYRDEVQYKYMGSMNQVASTASTTAGAREQSLLKMGKPAGTVTGEVLRLIAQFKTYWAQGLNITSELANAKPNEQMLAKGILMSGKKDYATVAQWLVGMTVIGYAEKAIRDMYDGKRPASPTSAKAWADAMAYGGAGGIYTDTLFSGSSFQNMSENLLGPTFGQIAGPGVKLVRQGMEDVGSFSGSNRTDVFRKTIKSEGVKLIRNNIPLQQFPLIKQGLDHLQYNVIQEALTPGYGLRRELKQLQQKAKGETL